MADIAVGLLRTFYRSEGCQYEDQAIDAPHRGKRSVQVANYSLKHHVEGIAGSGMEEAP